MTTSALAAIALRAVSHAYRTGANSGEIVALRDIDLSIARHQFVAIVGPSGCGKSTLLRLIAGLQTPTRGRVTVWNHEVRAPRDDIGVVFQKPTLLPWKSILDNVLFPLRARQRRVGQRDRQRARDILALVGLDEFATRLPHELSGGMQQRAGIARALLLDPDILLMDEPFGALDALTRESMSLELLRILAERPKTVVFITHSINEAVFLADRVIVMSPRPGRIDEDIRIELSRPRSSEIQSDPRFTAYAKRLREHIFGSAPAAADSSTAAGTGIAGRAAGAVLP